MRSNMTKQKNHWNKGHKVLISALPLKLCKSLLASLSVYTKHKQYLPWIPLVRTLEDKYMWKITWVKMLWKLLRHYLNIIHLETEYWYFILKYYIFYNFRLNKTDICGKKENSNLTNHWFIFLFFKIIMNPWINFLNYNWKY